MADKITNFNDYVNKEHKSQQKEHNTEPPKSEKPEQGLTQEIMSIEIEDPVQFFTEEERREYYRQRRKDEIDERIRTRVEKAREEERAARQEERRPERNDHYRDEAPSEEDFSEDDYEEEYDDEEYSDEEESEGGVNMDLVVRIASVITGLIILLFIALTLKIKVYDRYFAPDPDDTQVVAMALPEGYTAKDDVVVVTGASSLNLRSVPSTDSDEYIAAKADQGTELKRIAVSEDGNWAIVEYNGQQLYGYMTYLKVK